MSVEPQPLPRAFWVVVTALAVVAAVGGFVAAV